MRPQFSAYSLKASRWYGSISYLMMQVIFIAVFIGIDSPQTTSQPTVSAAAKVVASRINSRRSICNAEGADGVVPEATIRAAIRHYYLRPGKEHPRAGSPVLTTVPVYFHCSKGNFLTILRCLYKLQRDRIQTVAKIGWSWIIIEYVSEMRSAARAHLTSSRVIS